METAASWSTSRLRALLLIALLVVAGIGAAAPTQAKWSPQQAEQPINPAQIGDRVFVPIIEDIRGGTPNVTAWLRLSAPRINAGSFFSLTVLTKSTGSAPEPFINVFVNYNTGLVDFQSANTVPGDFAPTMAVSTSSSTARSSPARSAMPRSSSRHAPTSTTPTCASPARSRRPKMRRAACLR